MAPKKATDVSRYLAVIGSHGGAKNTEEQRAARKANLALARKRRWAEKKAVDKPI